MINKNSLSFPVLKTERLTLRQLSIDDQQPIFTLRSDAEINKYLEREPCRAIEDATNFISRINDNIKKGNSLYWVITLTNTKTFVGTICLFNFSEETSSCEIGYELMRQFQAQGIMKEAAAKVIGYAFQTLQFQKITAFTHKENRQSIKLLTKLYFLPSGVSDKENADFTIFTLTYKN